MGYNPAPDDQWTQDDLDRATAAKDYAAINRARHSGHLHDILNPPKELSDPVRGEINRIMQLWAQARARFGGTGDYLFGDWCAADIMFAPVVTRFITYGVRVPPFAGTYMKAVLSHPHVAEWIDKAQDEPWVIEQYEEDKAA